MAILGAHDCSSRLPKTFKKTYLMRWKWQSRQWFKRRVAAEKINPSEKQCFTASILAGKFDCERAFQLCVSVCVLVHLLSSTFWTYNDTDAP